MFSGIVVNLEDQDEMNMDEVCQAIDFEQSTPEEKQSLLALAEHMKTVTGEWEPLTNDLLFGDHDQDGDRWFTQYLDAGEMDRDMDAWEDEFACHMIFAQQPWWSRNGARFCSSWGGDPLVNKKTQANLCAEVIMVGDTYMTCESDYGKIFLPKHLMDGHKKGDLLHLRSQFKGFESARQTSLPWRALSILGSSPAASES
jgi:hypothetical protein